MPRSLSPPCSIYQLRWPHADASLDTRMRLALLNYLQRTAFENPVDDLAKMIDECQRVRSTPARRNRRTNVVIFNDNMLLKWPEYQETGVDTTYANRIALLDSEGGCSDTVRNLSLEIPNLGSLEVSVSFEREFHEHLSLIEYAVVVKIEALDVAGNIIFDKDKGRIAASLAYEWDQSVDNTDTMRWVDILHYLRRDSKIKFDSFGDDRTDVEMSRAREDLPKNFY